MLKSKQDRLRRQRRNWPIRVFNTMEEADQYDREQSWSMTPAGRLRNCERLRKLLFGYSKSSPLPPFPRTIRVTKMGDR